MRKGWIALAQEKREGAAKARLERVEKMRRRHVQNYLRDFGGWCGICGELLTRRGISQFRACKHAVPNGKPRRLLITDWEPTTMKIVVNGKTYETDLDGWTRRFVRGEEIYTKTVGDGAVALLHRIEAAQAGVVVEKRDLDRTTLLPSVLAQKPVPVQPVKLGKPKKAEVFDLSEWDVATQVSKEAARMSALSDRQEALRKKHVTKYRKAVK